MEVATTSNHSQSHHHHHHHNHHRHVSGAGGGGSRSPFQREVREWQRIDPDTGALFSGRLEADRWINGPLNSYGKISDSQNISQPNGTQHTQRKQLEVLRTANGSMQVIRTQTVQKTSSTSRWSTSSSSTTTRSSAAPLSLWPPKSSQGVDICELSDDADDINDDIAHIGSSAGVESPTASTSGHSHGHGQELIDDYVDFDVINGCSDNDDDTHLHKRGHNLLPDTAPSLKLSNLMKSSSSISSQSSNHSNLTTAAAAGNTHRSAGKVSLHAIVGQTAAAAAATPSLSSATSLSTWPKRLTLTEQADLYGQGHNNSSSSSSNSSGSSSKRRVGVVTTEPQTDAVVDGDVAAVFSTPTLRRDLESFRHYNDDAATATATATTTAIDNNEDLRLSARHQRRQQVSQSVYSPPLPVTFGSLQRSRSISTDDLSNDWQHQQQQLQAGEDDDEQPCSDWRRVSKLRRSFQSQDYHKATASPRPKPLDLPSSSVSVARIRAELENGRRLNTVMRNNHVDLAALDSILNASTPLTESAVSKPQLAKRSTFLTAESLQEIRGKLKKLSDESLYKADFLAHRAAVKPAAVAEVLHTPELVATAAPATVVTEAAPSAFRAVHNTHSLETRQRPKDTSSSEWHLRRKSYGFEKMSPPENRSIFRVDASTDSGLGRSGEQLGNWSPTERSAGAAHGPAATVIHFGRQQATAGQPASPNEAELSKRHSIAVEETWRDIRKTSQVHVNGESVNGNSQNNSSSQLQRSNAHKRVEFCKTEVHFAAESGRVNIVETDGKPPPTQNFRRRRRTASGPLQSLVSSSSSISSSSSSTTTNNSNLTHFGNDSALRGKPIAYRATVMKPPELVTQPVAGSQVTVITNAPKLALESRNSLLETTCCTSRHSYTSTSGVDTTDNETDELASIRGILKNKPIKPKPYHLGENIHSADALWSVPAAIRGEREAESPPSRENFSDELPITTKTVAERVRIVEQRQFDKQPQQLSPAGNGYSTKINVSLGAAEEWPETGATARRRSSTQELLLQDLRAHQRILNEGLKSTSLIMKTMRSASEFDEAMRRLSIASIESALIQPTVVVPTPMLRSHSYQEDSSRRPSTTSITSSELFGSTLYDTLPRTPLAPPRLKLLGNTQIPVSQQLTQLRRLYDAAEQEEDSADEEVKRYFRESQNSDSGGGTQYSTSPEDLVLKGSEYSSSWSRLKAKRTICKIEVQSADLPKSNVMNIALHAPSLQKPKPTPPTLRIGQLVPVAKPRTLLVQPQPALSQLSADTGDDSGSESLKIVKEARGARKLREHELSYFGVRQTPTPTQAPKLQALSNNARRTLPTRSKLAQKEERGPATTTTTTKWQLLNDRPDLLRHSPQGNDDSTNFLDDEHCYENIANELTTTFRIKSPSPEGYERKSDLQRDAQILSEMTRNADQTLKALSDEAAYKDQRRRSTSLQRRSNKPLATIDEKIKNGEAKALSIARGTFASEARRNSTQSTPSPTRARSSSQSSIECCPRDRSRSSSRESMTHGGCSSDEQLSKQRVERLRMRTSKREKTRHEPAEQRSTRQSSKPRPSSNAAPESKRTQYHSRYREKELATEQTGKHCVGSTSAASNSASRLLRSSRVSEENRPRTSSQRSTDREGERERARERDRDRDRERSRGSDKHRDELTRSRGHSSRSRHSEHLSAGHKSSRSSRSNPDTAANSSTHRKPIAASKSTAPTAATGSTTKTTTKASTNATTHKAPTTTTTTTSTTAHNELTPGKSTLIAHNGHYQHHQHHQHHHHSQHSGSKHHGVQQPQHHVHSLTTTNIAATRHQRDRHGKDRK